jgi:hypothetical protein
MKNFILSPPKLGFVVGTRGALAFGAGLLLSRKFSNSRRRTVGKSLVALGVLTTIPAALLVAGSRGGSSRAS